MLMKLTMSTLYNKDLVIWVSMKMRMKRRRAGMEATRMPQTGMGLVKPNGEINHPRLSEEVGVIPSGTSSFCWEGVRG